MNAVEKYLRTFHDIAPRDYASVSVVPAFREGFGIERTLRDIESCFGSDHHTIVVVNSHDRNVARESNLQTVDVCGDFSSVTVIDRFSDSTLSGVGEARRVGMDLAAAWLRETPDRFIVSLDADTEISGNYETALTSVSSAQNLALARYAHPLTHDAIVDYEIWLRLFAAGLRWCGSPFAWTALGSRFSVRVSAYCAVAGMPDREAGEDFHFMNKVVKNFGGETVAHLPVLVTPSDRKSDRVPFGTGPAVASADEKYKTLEPISAFIALRSLHRSVALRNFDTLAAPIRKVFDDENGWSRIEKLGSDSSDAQFPMRFYQWWDGLREIRFIRNAERLESRSSRAEAVGLFVPSISFIQPRDLLAKLRTMEG